VLCDLSPNNEPVAESNWKDACVEFLPEKSARQTWYDIRKRLHKKRYIEFHANGTVTRTMEGPGDVVGADQRREPPAISAID
jgi:hypothetical protein